MGRPTNGPEILYIREAPNMKRAVGQPIRATSARHPRKRKSLRRVSWIGACLPISAVSSPKLRGGVSSIWSARANSSQHHTFALVEHHFRPVRS